MKRLISFKVQSRMSKTQIFWSWIGAFTGISLLSLITSFALEGTGMTLVIGSFGASAVLIYGAVDSPLAQPRNLLGGHILSALVGVIAFQLFSEQIWLAAPFAVATAIAIMQLTNTLHPPGGATALIAVIGGEQVHNLGYIYVFFPVATGAVSMLFVALLVNHVAPGRVYPKSKSKPNNRVHDNLPSQGFHTHKSPHL